MLRFAILFALAAIGPALAQPVTDYLGVPGPIVLGDTSYELAWSSHPTQELTKHEYVPQGQTVDHYDRMLMVDFTSGEITPQAQAQAMAQALEQRKATDPVVNFELLQNEETGEAILDFVLSATDANGDIILEWNAYRYATATDADGQSGILLFAVSHRAYGEAAAQTFLSTLKTLRKEQVNLIAAATLPEL